MANYIRQESLRRLRYAFERDASLRDAASYAGVSKPTAMRYRILMGYKPRFANGWTKKFIPPPEIIDGRE